MSKELRNLKRPQWTAKEGFTLIELLIVIAIILILIAIALPNFLEAQERARVTRANGHLRTMETAIMSHKLQYGFLYGDYNDPTGLKAMSRNKRAFGTTPCPINSPGIIGDGGLTYGGDPNGNDPGFHSTFYAPSVHCPLTTPIKFIDGGGTVDPWSDGTVPVGMDSRYVDPNGVATDNAAIGIKYSAYFVSGPDRHNGEWLRGCNTINGIGVGCAYSPTNGTKSRGDLWFVIAEDTEFAKNEYIPLRTF